MAILADFNVAVLVTNGFEESELTEPVHALRKVGAHVEIVSLDGLEVQAFKHQEKGISVWADKTIDSVSPDDYDALLLPGGAFNADCLRAVSKVKSFVRLMHLAGKPLAVICHAPWILISAGLVKGRKLTGYHTIKDDIVNAGGQWLDQEVVVDGNCVSSRQPSDIPAFNREMIALFLRHKRPESVGEGYFSESEKRLVAKTRIS